MFSNWLYSICQVTLFSFCCHCGHEAMLPPSRRQDHTHNESPMRGSDSGATAIFVINNTPTQFVPNNSRDRLMQVQVANAWHHHLAEAGVYAQRR